MRELKLRQLDARFEAIRRVQQLAVPRGGWLRAIRTALGMTAVQLARRLGVSQANVSILEASEAKESITLKRLREVADALESDLVYVLVPRRSLARVREDQARLAATRILGRVDHMMALEDQALPTSEFIRQRDDLADGLLARWSREIWDDVPRARETDG